VSILSVLAADLSEQLLGVGPGGVAIIALISNILWCIVARNRTPVAGAPAACPGPRPLLLLVSTARIIVEVAAIVVAR